MKKLSALLNTPVRAVIAVGLIILVFEYLIMTLFEFIHGTFFTEDDYQLMVVFNYLDPILLIAIVSPAIYLLIFKPMRTQQAELERQLDELRSFQRLSIGRELRMKELAKEIAALRNPLSAESAGDIPVTSGSLETPRHAAEQPAATQPTEHDQRSALLFMLEDLEAARKKIELAHQEWMAALDVVEDPIFLHDAQFRILRCNKAYQQCAGIPFHELIGQLYYEVFPKTGAPLSCCLRAMEKAEEEEEEEEEEEVAVDGAIYRSRAFSVKDEQGAYLYSVHTLEDITERKQAEEKLRLHGEIERNMAEAVYLIRVSDGVIVHTNPIFDRMFGYEPGDLVGKHISIVNAPGDRGSEAVANEIIGSLMRTGVWNGEVHNIRKDGTTFWCHANVFTFEHPQYGRVWLSMHQDITERKRAEKALHESEEKFRKMSESAQDAIIMMADKRISFWNAAAERIFGYTAAEALGQEMHVLIAPISAHAAFAKAFPHFQQSGEGPIIGKLIEVAALRKGGKEFPVELSVSATQFGGQWHAVGIVRDISDRKRTENALHHLNRALKTLGTVNHALVYATDEDVLLHAVCHAIAEDGYQLAWVGYVQHDANKTIKVMTHAGHEAGYLETLGITWADTESSQAPCGQAVRSGIPVVCQNILSDPDFCAAWRNEALKRGYASLIALPLASEEGVFGVLCVHAAETDAFTVGEISLLEEMAADLAFGVAMLRLRLERDRAMKQSQNYLGGLRDSLEETVRAIALTVEMRDPYTAGHQRRVADLAVAIATQLGLPAEQVHGIHLAGTVHDLGKINIPSEILSKPGKISEMEFGFIKTHAQTGYDILKDINFPWPIAQMVLQHHERLDGSGYPQGLKGDAILLEARILSVADVVEAMSSHRPYRPGLGIEVALAEITKQRGIYFDTQVVNACLALFREQHYAFKS